MFMLPNLTSTEVGYDKKMTAPPPPHHQTHCVVVNLSSVNLLLHKSKTIMNHIKDNIQDNIKGKTKDNIKDNLKNT